MDAAGRDRIGRGKGAQVRGGELEIARRRRGVAIVELHIRRRIDSRRDLRCRECGRSASPANIRIKRKYPVNLDPNLANTAYRRTASNQAGEGRASDRGLRGED